jgi:SSS family transporter
MQFSTLDWTIFSAYFLILAFSSYWLSRKKVATSREYFLGGNTMPIIAVAISVVATSQSAATFLGGPDYAFRKDLTFIGFYVSGFLAVLFVAFVLIPKFYELKAMTVYELLGVRFGERAKKEAGIMFLIGRLFASGARLYIGALAIAMIIYGDIEAMHVAFSIAILMGGALVYALFGGVRSIIFSDVIQAVTYVGAGVAILVHLYMSLDVDFVTMVSTLHEANKLQTVDFSFSGGFSIWALLTGWLLLNIAAFGLDQDMTQRALSCKNEKEAQTSLIYSILFTLPIALLFLVIGLLLFLYYQNMSVDQNFQGQSITILMTYILYEMPEGLRGLVTVGAIAAALSSTNSVLGAMASVAVSDIYRPYKEAKRSQSEAHYVFAGRVAVVGFAVLLSIMAMISFYWQQTSDLPLLSFALGVMAFAYSGLLGVYFSALFTKRGNEMTVTLGLVGGFVTVLLLQPAISSLTIGFAWQIVIGTVVSFVLVQLGSVKRG